VPGYEESRWYGVGVPKTMLTEIVEKLNRCRYSGSYPRDKHGFELRALIAGERSRSRLTMRALTILRELALFDRRLLLHVRQMSFRWRGYFPLRSK